MVQQDVDRWIAENNIVRLQKKIDSERDPFVQKVLEGLLDREKIRLKGMLPKCHAHGAGDMK